MTRLYNITLKSLAGLTCLLLASACSLHGRAPHVDFAWRQGDTQLHAVPRTRPEVAPNSRTALLWEDNGSSFAALPRPDAPNEKDWREVRGTDKGPTIIGLSLNLDLSTHTWTTRTGIVRRGSVNGLTPQFVVSFDDL